MELGNLTTYRILVPGALVLICLVPLYLTVTDTMLNDYDINKILSSVIVVISCYAVGTIYDLYCVRSIFNNASHTNITNNIKERLLDIGRTAPITEERRSELMQGKELMDIFYFLIDSNTSLIERGKKVKQNGLIWSSLSDIALICGFFLLYIYAFSFLSKTI